MENETIKQLKSGLDLETLSGGDVVEVRLNELKNPLPTRLIFRKKDEGKMRDSPTYEFLRRIAIPSGKAIRRYFLCHSDINPINGEISWVAVYNRSDVHEEGTQGYNTFNKVLEELGK